MKIYKEVYNLIKRMDKLEAENKQLKELIAVAESKIESGLIEVNNEIEAIEDFQADLLNRVEIVEEKNNIRRERRKK